MIMMLARYAQQLPGRQQAAACQATPKTGSQSGDVHVKERI
jgi:hypothetical protein